MDFRVSDEMQVVIELRNGKPVELVEFANSMIAFGSEYTDYLVRAGAAGSVPDAKLYIRDIREGSIVATLGALASVTVPMFEQVNVVFDYAVYFSQCLKWLRDRAGARPDMDKGTLNNITKFVQPVTQDSNGVLNIGTINNNGELHLHFSAPHADANAIQNAAQQELKLLGQSVSGPRDRVALYWAQASNTEKNRPADKARIDSIYDKPVRVIFEDESMKRAMLFDEPHAFQKVFIVDVQVESVGMKPVSYRVTRLHEVIDKSDL